MAPCRLDRYKYSVRLNAQRHMASTTCFHTQTLPLRLQARPRTAPELLLGRAAKYRRWSTRTKSPTLGSSTTTCSSNPRRPGLFQLPSNGLGGSSRYRQSILEFPPPLAPLYRRIAQHPSRRTTCPSLATRNRRGQTEDSSESSEARLFLDNWC